MYPENDALNALCPDGPKVFSRPGTKRWQRQVFAQRVFLAVRDAGNRARVRTAQAREAAANARAEDAAARVVALRVAIDILIFRALMATKPAGSA